MAFFEAKRAAREALHREMSRAALYYPPEAATPTDAVLVRVRLHYKFDPLGDQQGTNFNFAEKHEVIPRVVFDRREVEPERGAVVSFGGGEAYELDTTLPPDDFTITAPAPRMPAHKAVAYPGPESAHGG